MKLNQQQISKGTKWLPFITQVLAFIGLYQVISNSARLFHQWF